MPAHKKDPGVRARRNKTPGSATLPARQLAVVPEPIDYDECTVVGLKDLIDQRNTDGRPVDARLSKRGSKASLIAALVNDDARATAPPSLPTRVQGWTDQTRAWWADVWSSPMHHEWDDSDVHNVAICALLYDDMWVGETAKARKDAASEFRLQCARLGLDPYSRRRLEWQIEAAEESKARGQQRRTTTTGGAGGGRQGAKKKDPRSGLHSA